MITLDGYAASHRAVAKLKTSGILPRRVQVRSCKYLNNVIEQDHRRIKQRVRPMLGFKRFETAAVTIRGSTQRKTNLTQTGSGKCIAKKQRLFVWPLHSSSEKPRRRWPAVREPFG